MKRTYVAVVRLLIEADDEAMAADSVHALLAENMQAVCEGSCFLDWRYEDFALARKGEYCYPVEVTWVPGRGIPDWVPA